jgi:hypothetical protein
MKSWTQPTRELVERTIASTIDSEQRRYFFYKLQNPLWVKPLLEKGFFRNPPEPFPTGDGGFQIPLWPESQYLARIAKESPDDVINIALQIKTGNPRVLEDIVDMALAIEPSDLSKQLYGHAILFADNQFTRWNCQKLAKLIIHWAQRGATAEALGLADKLVCLCPDPKAKEKEETLRADPHSPFLRLEPRSPYGDYVFKKVLEEGIKQLAEMIPWDTVQILSRNLGAAISLSFFEQEKASSYDASDFWCHRLKDEERHEHDAKSGLAHALTNACEALLRKEPQRIEELDLSLRQHNWYFFKRLRWYLYAQFPIRSKALMRMEAINFDGYYDGEYGFELASMLRAASETNALNDGELRQIFETIERGPDIEAFKKWFGGTPSDEQIQVRKEYFYVRQLFPFAPVLLRFPEYWAKYQAYAKKIGELKLSDYFKVRIGDGGGAQFVPDTSPISEEELKAKSDEDLLQFLGGWKPPSKRNAFDEPNVSGLAKAFTLILNQQPDRFMGLADRMNIANPTCVRDFLYFLVERAKQKQPLPWEKVIHLCQWVVEQPNHLDESNQDSWREGEPDFTACRQSIAGLFQHGSCDYQDSIPWECREAVFQIIKRLCTEYDRRLKSESFGKDFLTSAINSVRGEAAHALVDHGLWIKRHLKLETNAIAKMPEVQLLLEERLNPENEKALAVHAVFGLLAPWLCHLDRDWFASVQSHIFPVEKELFERWFAAWKTFVSWNQPNALVFRVLKQEYGVAVERLDGLREDDKSQHPAVNALGEHLITFYWCGLLPLTGEESLLEKYLAKANSKERAHVMNYIGRALENTKDLPKEVETLLVTYWQHRLEAIKHEHKPEESSEELSDFAWWFRSGKLDTSWCLRQIQELLKLTPQVHETYLLLEDLAKVAPSYPIEAATCLQMIVSKISGDRYVYLDDRPAKEILNVSMNSKIQEAVAIAQYTQDTLLRLGRFEYKDLAQVVEQ